MNVKGFLYASTVFKNLDIEVDHEEFSDIKTATDMKHYMERFFKLEFLSNIKSFKKGNKVEDEHIVESIEYYSILRFVNEKVSKFHDFSIDIPDHETWKDRMFRLEEVFCKIVKHVPQNETLISIETKKNKELYDCINENSSYEEFKESVSQHHFLCLFWLYKLFEPTTHSKNINNFHARAKKQIHDCQCKSRTEAVQELRTVIPNKDAARLIVNKYSIISNFNLDN